MRMTPQTIVDIICDYYKQNPSEILSKCRKREYVKTRQVIMYFLEEFTDLSLNKIGSIAGGKDHATVIHSRKTINNDCDTDKNFKVEIMQIMSIIRRRKQTIEKTSLQYSMMEIYGKQILAEELICHENI